jgi:N-carbamoylputrescine amidase
MSMAKADSKHAVTVALVQMSAGDNPEANLKKALEKISAAAKKGAEIVCLQELFRSRYFCQSEDGRNFRLAEPVPGPTTDSLAEAARAHEVVIVASVFEKRSAGLYHNTAAIIDADGALVGKYRKMHIPDDPLYYEKFYFAPGDLGFPSFQTRYAKIAALVCWDQWFPEGARLAALSGAEILFYPTAIGWIPGEPPRVARQQREAWQLIQRSHALANGVYVAAANRVGREGKIRFWGRSFVAGPFGELVARAGSEREEIVIARCDLNHIGATRESWPFLRDRRIDAYAPLQSRFLQND